jgi:glycosyltransferase involved in cell wall biosynthesis
MGYVANKDAVVYFCRDIFARVRKYYPELALHIVGKSPDSEIRDLSRDKNIIVTGHVKDIRAYFQRNVILVVPLRIGEGTRLKILEAMASGVPVVSTGLGCEGIEVTGGKNILLADSPQEFSDRLLELLENGGMREKLGKNSRELVEQYYDWKKIVKDLNKVYEEVIKEFA